MYIYIYKQICQLNTICQLCTLPVNRKTPIIKTNTDQLYVRYNNSEYVSFFELSTILKLKKIDSNYLL